jgi:hypothetical protein
MRQQLANSAQASFPALSLCKRAATIFKSVYLPTFYSAICNILISPQSLRKVGEFRVLFCSSMLLPEAFRIAFAPLRQAQGAPVGKLIHKY